MLMATDKMKLNLTTSPVPPRHHAVAINLTLLLDAVPLNYSGRQSTRGIRRLLSAVPQNWQSSGGLYCAGGCNALGGGST
jgi:hypothetical protein